MNCPSCGAGMRLEAERAFFSCEYCGSVYFPEPNADGVRVLGEPASSKCPVCAIPLEEAAIGDRRILYCAHCRGMLIAMGAFMGIVQDLRSRRETASEPMIPPDPKALDRRIRCPQCSQWMETHPYGGPGDIVIDNCENCLLDWLDSGELDRIVRAPDHDYTGEAWKPVKPVAKTAR